MLNRQVHIDQQRIAGFCRKWKAAELSVFGSALGPEFRSDSDIDILVSFLPQAKWSSFDLVDMQDELEAIFGRPVDMVEEDTLRNPFRRQAILSTKETLYAA